MLNLLRKLEKFQIVDLCDFSVINLEIFEQTSGKPFPNHFGATSFFYTDQFHSTIVWVTKFWANSEQILSNSSQF